MTGHHIGIGFLLKLRDARIPVVDTSPHVRLPAAGSTAMNVGGLSVSVVMS